MSRRGFHEGHVCQALRSIAAVFIFTTHLHRGRRAGPPQKRGPRRRPQPRSDATTRTQVCAGDANDLAVSWRLQTRRRLLAPTQLPSVSVRRRTEAPETCSWSLEASAPS